MESQPGAVLLIEPAAECIGRETEMAELLGALDEARSGRGRLVLLSGEPGIGKTCLARAFAAQADGSGATVLWGNCWEGDGAPAFWPWIQIVREYAQGQSPQTLVDQMGAGAADIGRLVPEVAMQLPDVQVVPDLTQQHGRFRLFDSITALVRNAARTAPVVLVLDDLHWADAASVSLLHFLVRELARSGVLVLGMYRDAEVTQEDPLSERLADFAKESSRHLSLRGLDKAGVAAVMESTAGTHPDASVAAGVHRRTHGNPFYVREFTRLLAAQQAQGQPPKSVAAGIPQGVREVLERRLARLSADSVAALSAAAVIGQDFRVELVARVTDLDAVELLGHLDEAAAARIVVESPTAPGRYSFSHGLVRDALYDLQGAGRRVETHRRIAEALEATPEAGWQLAEIAYHYFKASPAGDPSKAVEYAVRAGDHAAGVFAYEEAAGHYERALVAVAASDVRRRCGLLIALGEMQRRMGDVDRARNTFGEAAELARDVGDATTLGQAALGTGGDIGGWGMSTRTDDALIILLEEALAAVGDGHPALRARLLSRLAVELYWTDQIARRREMSDEAVTIARRLGDPTVELLALYSRHWATLAPHTLDERLAAADDLLVLARRVGNAEATYLGHQFRATALIERGDMDAATEEMAACERVANELKMPLYHWQTAVLQVMHLLLGGRLDEAERAITEALGTIQDADSEIATSVFGGQLLVIRWLQGRIDEFGPAVGVYMEQAGAPVTLIWRAAQAFVDAETGQLDRTASLFSELAANDFTDVVEGLRLLTLWVLAHICATLRDADRAPLLYDLIRPYADLDVVAGPAAVSLGSASHALGVLATTTGRWQEAERHFEDAVTRNEATRNRPLLALTLREYAGMLLARGTAADRERAQALLDRARSIMREHRLHGLSRRADELATLAEQPPANLFRRDGAVWLIRFGGREVRVKHAKGVGDLARLLTAPGRELHVMDLAGGAASRRVDAAEAAEAGLTVTGTASDSILDEHARQAYKARIVELDDDLTEAEDAGDAERAARARAERDALAAQLAAAYGLGGRDRRAGDPVERARKAVAWRIREAIRRIGELDPELGRHLDRSIRTGMFCSYVADEPTRWSSAAD